MYCCGSVYTRDMFPIPQAWCCFRKPNPDQLKPLHLNGNVSVILLFGCLLIPLTTVRSLPISLISCRSDLIPFSTRPHFSFGLVTLLCLCVCVLVGVLFESLFQFSHVLATFSQSNRPWIPLNLSLPLALAFPRSCRMRPSLVRLIRWLKPKMVIPHSTLQLSAGCWIWPNWWLQPVAIPNPATDLLLCIWPVKTVVRKWPNYSWPQVHV